MKIKILAGRSHPSETEFSGKIILCVLNIDDHRKIIQYVTDEFLEKLFLLDYFGTGGVARIPSSNHNQIYGRSNKTIMSAKNETHVHFRSEYYIL